MTQLVVSTSLEKQTRQQQNHKKNALKVAKL